MTFGNTGVYGMIRDGEDKWKRLNPGRNIRIVSLAPGLEDSQKEEGCGHLKHMSLRGQKRTTSCVCVQYTTLHCIPLDKLRAMVEIEAGRIVVGQTWSYEEAGNLRTRGLGYREEGMTDKVPARCSRAPFTSN